MVGLKTVDIDEIKRKKGYKKSQPKMYTRELLIEMIQQFVREKGMLPTVADFTNNPDYPSIKPYLREFGSWTGGLIAAKFKPDDEATRSRQGEIQQLSEFKIEGVVDLSGKNRNSTCDGICPKGEEFGTKSASLTINGAFFCWHYRVSERQLKVAKYLFLRAYEDKDFTKPPKYRWRVPVEFADGKKDIFIYKDKDWSKYNIKNMEKYEI
jgi:hypothetical protein